MLISAITKRLIPAKILIVSVKFLAVERSKSKIMGKDALYLPWQVVLLRGMRLRSTVRGSATVRLERYFIFGAR